MRIPLLTLMKINFFQPRKSVASWSEDGLCPSQRRRFGGRAPIKMNH